MKKSNKSKYIIANIIVSTIILMLVFTNKAMASVGTVTTETLNLRKEPSTSSVKLELLNEGDEVKIISEEENWYKVEFRDKVGYVSKDYVAIEDGQEVPQEPTSTPSEPKKPSDTDETGDSDNSNNQDKPNTPAHDDNIRANTTIKLDKDVTIKILPLINSSNLGSASAGEELTVITTANNWAFVQTNEIAGWIVKDSSVGQTIQNNNSVTQATDNDGENNNSENGENNGQDNEENNTNNNDDNNNGNNSNNNNDNDSDNNENNNNNNQDGTNYEQSVTKFINGSSVYMRSEPSTSSDVVTILIKNTDVIVTGESGDWYKVKFEDYSGYIYKELLSDEKVVETNRSNSHREDVEKNGSGTNSVNEESSSNANSENGGNNTTTASSKGNEIVEYAKQYLGCPYVYGGSGSKSFDCSGFTMYVYKNFGYSLSHSATAQSKMGEYVAKENLQPGDLVFFLDYETMDGIGHCGIYIGEGNFIHASSGSGYCVKISTLTSGSYLKRYATARRLI